MRGECYPIPVFLSRHSHCPLRMLSFVPGTWEYTDKEMVLHIDRQSSALDGPAEDFNSGEWSLLEYNG